MRILDMEGVARNDLRKKIADMELDDLMDLINIFDEYDCGVEGTLEIECPECGGIQEIQLPFEGAFFFPKRKAKRTQEDTTQTETHP